VNYEPWKMTVAFERLLQENVHGTFIRRDFADLLDLAEVCSNALAGVLIIQVIPDWFVSFVRSETGRTNQGG
jgi:hypothetical protein